jgi:hypothetical protein
MGLDMYLTKQVYVKNWDHYQPKDRWEITVAKGGQPITPAFPISYLTLEVAYWRKANAIHAWFVQECQDGVDDCREAGLERWKLTELLELCRRAKAEQDTNLLPTQGGFFFGSTDYDEGYWQDIEDTIGQLEAALKDDAIGGSFYYHSSW